MSQEETTIVTLQITEEQANQLDDIFKKQISDFVALENPTDHDKAMVQATVELQENLTMAMFEIAAGVLIEQAKAKQQSRQEQHEAARFTPAAKAPETGDPASAYGF